MFAALTSPSSPWPSRMLSVFRIVAGAIFFLTGLQKVFGVPASPMPMPPFDPLTEVGVAGLLELVGGALITVGAFTRPVAFLLAGEMAVAYFQFHAPKSPYPTVNMGVPAVLYCFFFLYLVFAGAGAWSVDAAVRREIAR